ncbi:MAG: PLP-dependent aminotransferase family protein [Acidobacteriota bacterium]
MASSYRFSRVAQSLRPSPIRELFAVSQRPGMISFAGGLPDPEIFPVDQFAECAEVLRVEGRVALQYGASEGYRPLVDQLRARMEPVLGAPVAPEHLVVTTGSQQVMDLLARVLVDPGDTVVVEAPTYPGALHTFRAAGARFALVPCDEFGMRTELLDGVLESCRRESGRPPALIYTITNFSNPSGACLAGDRREHLVAAAARHGVPVFEDDPYGELRFRGAPQPTVYGLAGGKGVVFASSFSKILAPGVRVAWAVGEAELVRRLVIAKQGIDLCTPMVAQVLVSEYCRRGFLDAHLPRIRAHYAGKATAMAGALRRHLSPDAARWTDPDGGFFFWLDLGRRDSRTVFEQAVDAGVAFLPGSAFFPHAEEVVLGHGDGTSFARLCFTFAGPGEIDEGCRRLGLALATA